MMTSVHTLFLQVIDIINEEEKQFLKTLSRGKRVFEKTIDKVSAVIPGRLATVWYACHSVWGLDSYHH